VRTSLLRTAALTAVTLGVVTGLPSQAASPYKPTAISDATGDGNGLNGQGFVSGQSTTTPSDYSGGDIVSISWKTLGTKTRLAGFQVVMTLSSAPSPATIYRVTTATGDCSVFWLTYTVYPDGPTSGGLQHDCPGFNPTNTTGSSETVELSPVVSGSTITWTVPSSSLPKAVKKGTKITELSGETRFMAGSSQGGGATVPVIDEADGDAVYTYGR
jgi:hypothetical protein